MGGLEELRRMMGAPFSQHCLPMPGSSSTSYMPALTAPSPGSPVEKLGSSTPRRGSGAPGQGLATPGPVVEDDTAVDSNFYGPGQDGCKL